MRRRFPCAGPAIPDAAGPPSTQLWLRRAPEVKSACLAWAAALLPLAATAQVVQFQVQCLPEAQQQEIRQKARAITDETERRKREQLPSFGPGLGLMDAQRHRDASAAAVAECAARAKQAGRSSGEACERELTALRAASEAINQLATGMKTHIRPIEEEERIRLEQLRAQYPACPATVTVKR